MKIYIILLVLIIIALATFVLRSEKTGQFHCIELCNPDIEFTIEYIQGADTASTIEAFQLDTVKLTSRPNKNEIDSAGKIVSNLIRQRKFRTGIIIDFSHTAYKGFIEVLDIFIKNKITQVCFKNEKIYFFPCKPPREFMTNRLYINKDFHPKNY